MAGGKGECVWAGAVFRLDECECRKYVFMVLAKGVKRWSSGPLSKEWRQA